MLSLCIIVMEGNVPVLEKNRTKILQEKFPVTYAKLYPSESKEEE